MHTLVLDIGKSNAKLVLMNNEGDVLAHRVRSNASVSARNYMALGVDALEHWLLDAIPTLPERHHIDRIGITTHGAAFCAMSSTGLALPPIDYEWDAYGATRQSYEALLDDFNITGSPLLPLGLNAGLQLYWLQQHCPQEWARIEHWLPYPQYWAWWLAGEWASEATSLGCHTHLWQPSHNDFAPWAKMQGLTERFAPLRSAHEALGTVRTELASALGLPRDCAVYTGLHDSNACLARHLHAQPGATVVSTGTWTVIMAPCLSEQKITLQPALDQLLNQSVEGKPVPTARFMGGREFSHLCHGADPSLATQRALLEVVNAGWLVLPEDSSHGQGVHGRVAELLQGEQSFGNNPGRVPLHLRPALAAWYCALMTTKTLHELIPAPLMSSENHTLILEGPMAKNPAFVTAFAALSAPAKLLSSNDEIEGTARGAWLSTRWHSPPATQSRYSELGWPQAEIAARLQAAAQTWRERLASKFDEGVKLSA